VSPTGTFPLRWTVIENYRDGGVWPHYFFTEEDARRHMKAMQEAHPPRTYELVGPEL
jgi:hypothetical protein